MNWIKNVVRPRIQSVFRKKDTPDHLWKTCPHCSAMIFHRDLAQAFNVCTKCGFHMALAVEERFRLLFDGGSADVQDSPSVPHDPLRFRDQKRYRDRLREAKRKTGREDSITVALGAVEGVETVMAVHDFAFMGGSLGMAAGEAMVSAIALARKKGAACVAVTAAGGARMQEGILSLMQMPRCAAALQSLRDAALPYVVLLTHPTTGGVTASYAMLGDVHIAEPGALIGFAGPRVIKQTIRQTLPEGFQSAEYLLDHGMIDMVVPRAEQRRTLAKILRFLMPARPAV